MKKILLFSIAAILIPLGAVRAGAVSFSDTRDYDGRVAMPPTIVAQVDSASDYQNLTMPLYPADNAVFAIDESMNVLGASGDIIAPFSEVFDGIGGRVISNFIIDNEAEIGAIKAFSESHNFFDFAFISPDEALLRAAKNAVPEARAMLDLSAGYIDAGQAVFAANRAGANGVILAGGGKREVEAFQHMMKAVWIRHAVEGGRNWRFGIYKALSTGAFGIWTDDAQAVHDVIEELDGETSLLLRTPVNAAHRGDPYLYNENSIEGSRFAFEAGATHIELDFRLTKDCEIVVMHDDDISRTTDGHGNISSMTYEELSRFSINKTMTQALTGVKSKIPTADDVFGYMRDSGVNLLLEIKSGEQQLIDKLAQKIEEYGVANKIVIISFDRTQLSRAREKMPHIWALDLNVGNAEVGANVRLMSRMEVGYDSIKSVREADPGFVKDMADRGFLPAFWTFDNKSEFNSAMLGGVYCITNNAASESCKNVAYIEAEDIPSSAKVGDAAKVKIYTLGGKATEGEGEIIAVNNGEAVITANLNSTVRAMTVAQISTEGGTSEQQSQNKGCKGCKSAASGAALPLALVVGFVAKRNKNTR